MLFQKNCKRLKNYFPNLIVILLFLSVKSEKLYDEGERKNVIFETPDFSVYLNDNLAIEAFKLSTNDEVIEKRNESQYDKLKWISIGVPQIVHHVNANQNLSNETKNDIFFFNKNGFVLSISTSLAPEYRNLLQQLMKDSYNISVSEAQIQDFVPEMCKCSIKFLLSDLRYLINGEEIKLNKSSSELSIYFNAPIGTNERVAFERKMQDEDKNDFEIDCNFLMKNKIVNEENLIIKAHQLQELGIIVKLFGAGDETYLTKDHLYELGAHLYANLNLMSEFEIPEGEFKEFFSENFTKEAFNESYKYIAIEEALLSLSKFKISKEINLNHTIKELSNVFKVRQICNTTKEYINFYRKFMKKHKNHFHAFKLNFFLKENVVKLVEGASLKWARSNLSIETQLDELNNFDKIIKWGRHENKIVPIKIEVAKLKRSQLMNDIELNRIKRYTYDTKLIKSISFNTFDSFESFEKIPYDENRRNNLTVIYPTGDKYSGDIIQGKRDGLGSMIFHENDKYERIRYDGEWKDSQMFGNGTMTYKNGDLYEGEFKNNIRHGKGKLSFGMFDFLSRKVYYGDFKDDLMHGFGKLNFTNRDYYEGEFKYDKRDGKGKAFSYDEVIEAEYKDDFLHGFGISVKADGEKFSGEYKNGFKSGNGTFYFSKHDTFKRVKYVGEFKEGEFNGKGTLYYGEKDNLKRKVYVGDMKNGEANGKGVLEFQDGSRIEGQFRFDRIHGKGTFYWPNGFKYEGGFNYGSFHGNGKIISPNGTVHERMFKNEDFN